MSLTHTGGYLKQKVLCGRSCSIQDRGGQLLLWGFGSVLDTPSTVFLECLRMPMVQSGMVYERRFLPSHQDQEQGPNRRYHGGYLSGSDSETSSRSLPPIVGASQIEPGDNRQACEDGLSSLKGLSHGCDTTLFCTQTPSIPLCHDLVLS